MMKFKLALGMLAILAAIPSSTAQCAPRDAKCFCTSRAPGYYADTTVGCQSYYWCVSATVGYYQSCGLGAVFNEKIKVCDLPTNVQCGGGSGGGGTPVASPPPPPPSSALRRPPPPAASTCTYTVKQGDTLWAIANAYGTTVTAILAANPQITDPNLIQAGQVINLPSCSGGGGGGGGGGSGQLLGNAWASYHMYGPTYDIMTTNCAATLASMPRAELMKYGWTAYCASYMGGMPFGTQQNCGVCLRVTNLNNGKSTIMRIVDRCNNGYNHIKGGPGIDADEAALMSIAGPSSQAGMTDVQFQGGISVKLERVTC